MSIRFRWVAALVLPTALGLSTAVAQETAVEQRQDQRQDRREDRRDGLRGAAQRVGEVVTDVADAIRGDQTPQSNDAVIVGILIPRTQEEIALSQLAQERSQNPQVRQFAEAMIQDHTQFLNQLRRFGGMAAGPAEPADADAPEQRRQSRIEVDPNRPAAEPGVERDAAVEVETDRQGAQVEVERRGAADPAQAQQDNLAAQAPGLDIVQIHRQIGERCLAMTKDRLQRKQGAHFDKAYMSLNIPAHIGMLASLEVLQDHASPELQQLLQQGAQTAQQHLQHAEQVMQQLAQADGAEQPAQRPQRRANTQNQQ